MEILLRIIMPFMLVVLVLVAHGSGDHPNQCMVYHGGCGYHVSLKKTNCMVRDEPGNSVEVNEVHHKKHKERNEGKEDKVDEEKDDEEDEVIVDEDGIEFAPLKRMEHLERKLLKMMDGLSVRSLRHIRQIRNDLRQMTSTLDLLKMQNGNKKSKHRLGCPPEFMGVGTWSSCYRFSNFNATWHEAREYCNAFGAELVSLDTLKEAYILDYLIKSNPDYDTPKGYWTSGNYIVRSQRWMWTTKHHLKPMAYSRWGPGEPDARSTMHCMLLYKYADYRWHDAVCTDRHHFICEIEI